MGSGSFEVASPRPILTFFERKKEILEHSMFPPQWDVSTSTVFTCTYLLNGKWTRECAMEHLHINALSERLQNNTPYPVKSLLCVIVIIFFILQSCGWAHNTVSVTGFGCARFKSHWDVSDCNTSHVLDLWGAPLPLMEPLWAQWYNTVIRAPE